jgi:UPF0755 protein
MSQTKKPLLVLILLMVALIGSILILSWKLRSTSVELGYGSVDGKFNFLQKFRYSVQIYLSRESLVVEKTPPEIKLILDIQPGETVQSVCNHLNFLYPNLNSKLCRNYLVYRSLDRKVEPGIYSIPGDLPAYQVFQYISDPANRTRTLRIYPGWRLEEITAAIQMLGLKEVPSQALLEKLRKPDASLVSELQLEHGQSLEGYLLPGEYAFEPGVNLDTLLWQLSAPFRELLLSGEIQTKGLTHGFSAREVLTLASIIQRETLRAEEMPKMASVFYNRLTQGMPLQTDPTVQFAIGYDQDSASWWKPVLSKSDLQVNSLYNTYQVNGLPPSPISSPGFEAIQAVLNPENTDYLFFRAKCDGSGLHDFSVTYQEHLNKACP